MQIRKKYGIYFTDSSFERSSQEKNISKIKRQYTRTIAEMNKNVEELDRFDEFDSLQIDVEKYRKQDGSLYGIVPMANVTEPILPHQQKAALGFLKELRGFGLLADVVGSGKTFEAGVVLSELAFRNKIRSMLFVVPTQVINAWKDVMEMKFGLGKGQLLDLSATGERNKDGSCDTYKIRFTDIPTENINGFKVPTRPILVAMEDFVKWDDVFAQLLFDVIVVDEAHHLCSEEGVYAQAMRLLSLMMETKKKAKVTYLLLLSATPHSGNLENMFRLWYFIKCKGGNPNDFEEKEDVMRSDAYLAEKEYYKTAMCKNSKTVMEFIKKVKIEEVQMNYSKQLKSYIASNEEYSGIKELSKVEQYKAINDFLFHPDNYEIYENVKRRIASSYHNGLLRSIMIRQPAENMVGQSKKIINYLFYPTDKKLTTFKTQVFDMDIVFDPSKINTNEAITYDGDKYSVRGFFEENIENYTYQSYYSELMLRSFIYKFDNRMPLYNFMSVYYKFFMGRSNSF